MTPDFSYEVQYTGHVAGLDEAGRGPWAGPVVAGACILDPETVDPQLIAQLDDSKKLTRAKREAIFKGLTTSQPTGVWYGIGESSVEEIDRLNILQATFLSMRRAVANLPKQPQYLLIDGNQNPDLGWPSECIVKGDSKSLSIAAASILAKVHRDRLMEVLAKDYPGYGWDSNAGYGTKTHQQGLAACGVTPHHRISYAPIQKCLERTA